MLLGQLAKLIQSIPSVGNKTALSFPVPRLVKGNREGAAVAYSSPPQAVWNPQPRAPSSHSPQLP